MHQSAGVRVDGAFTQLQRVHFTQSLETGFRDFAAFFLGCDAFIYSFAFLIVQRVKRFLAYIDPVQRWHGDKNMAGFDQCREMLQKQGGQERGDVQAVRIGIGQDDNLAVAQPGNLVRTGVHADGNGDVVYFGVAEYGIRLHFPGIEDLAPERENGLEFAFSGLFRRAAC